MKSYNIQNYIRYKTDLERTIARIEIKVTNHKRFKSPVRAKNFR